MKKNKFIDFKNWKRSRLKITLLALLYFAITGWLGIFMKMESVALVAIGGITPILTMYIWSEGKRPSDSKTSTETFTSETITTA